MKVKVELNSSNTKMISGTLHIEIPELEKILNDSKETFTVGGIEYIKLEESDGKILCTTKELLSIKMKYDSNSCDPRTSEVMKYLNGEYYNSLLKIVRDNLVKHTADLTTLDGQKNYGTMQVKISMLTTDQQFRLYTHILDRYPVNEAYMLLTPYSTPERGYSYNVCYVDSDGTLNCDSCDWRDYGVRPFLIFKSSILVS